MSNISGHKFEGFSKAHNGIGDDLINCEHGSELSDGNNNNKELPVNNTSDTPNNDGWHEQFNIHERGLPHIFLP